MCSNLDISSNRNIKTKEEKEIMNLHFSHVGFTFLGLCLSSTPKDLDNLHKDKFYAWDNMKVADIFEIWIMIFYIVAYSTFTKQIFC